MNPETPLLIASQKKLIESIEAEILTCTPGSPVWLFWTDWRQREYTILRELETEEEAEYPEVFRCPVCNRVTDDHPGCCSNECYQAWK